MNERLSANESWVSEIRLSSGDARRGFAEWLARHGARSIDDAAQLLACDKAGFEEEVPQRLNQIRIREYLSKGRGQSSDAATTQDSSVSGAANGTSHAAPAFATVSKLHRLSDRMLRESLRLEDPIGRGGFGVVLRGTYTHPGGIVQKIAYKRFQGSVSDGKVVEAAKSEVEILLALQAHPYIVNVLGFNDNPEAKDANGKEVGLGFVMEYANVGDLLAFINEQNEHWAWEERLLIMAQISSALVFLHTQPRPILHRDLKSCNVLLTRVDMDPLGRSGPSLVAKLTDFGLSTVRKTSAASTRGLAGTYAWCAPERFKRGNKYQTSADVFSMAMVFYEVITRKVPWHDCEDETEIIGALRDEERPYVAKEQDPGCPPSLVEDVVKRCWAQDPSSRPSAIEAFESLLDLAHSQAEGGAASHDSAVQELLKNMQRDMHLLMRGQEGVERRVDEVKEGIAEVKESIRRISEGMADAVEEAMSALRSELDASGREHAADLQQLRVGVLDVLHKVMGEGEARVPRMFIVVLREVREELRRIFGAEDEHDADANDGFREIMQKRNEAASKKLKGCCEGLKMIFTEKRYV
uniref:Protein kinase domain-containing protein n=1 Tax=Phaeomonas parva TaxID=124430 RepID=A0A7S1U8K4_9STRA|mmetsp:Transcript_35828/g.112399  ORF Transcript_35828/g.112399 Transcript_35828/m.112399 type:complete len:582 (+) Transcript_35828:495-2240(+)